MLVSEKECTLFWFELFLARCCNCAKLKNLHKFFQPIPDR